MRTDKIKKVINSSFITNQDLLQNMRQKSYKISRDSSKLNLNQKISLIPKRQFVSNSPSQYQNKSFLANQSQIKLQKDSSQSKKYQSGEAEKLLESILKENIDERIKHKVKKSIEYIRSIQQIYIKSKKDKEESVKKEKKLEQVFHKKFEQIQMQNIKLKKQIACLQQKIYSYQNQKYSSNTYQPQQLQQIILTQSQLINQQCDQHKQQQQQMRQILKAQALSIETFLHQPSLNKKHNRSAIQLSEYISF